MSHRFFPGASSPSSTPRSDTGLTDDQVSRWADLIVGGGAEFPVGLSASDRDRLAGAVRRGLRERLLRLIAQALAARLSRRSTPEREMLPDAGTQV